jgi:hypothetical protein
LGGGEELGRRSGGTGIPFTVDNFIDISSDNTNGRGNMRHSVNIRILLHVKMQ